MAPTAEEPALSEAFPSGSEGVAEGRVLVGAEEREGERELFS